MGWERLASYAGFNRRGMEGGCVLKKKERGVGGGAMEAESVQEEGG